MQNLPKMAFIKEGVLNKPIKVFQVNDSIIIGVYKGALSKYDILIKYRQKRTNGKWSNIRTPKLGI
ncbi:MAG: hypothetical protein LHV68_06835 [Elusimicrobia bacterium]|nr:hypothetical protein [Candidatus Liberimonas magnetica]